MSPRRWILAAARLPRRRPGRRRARRAGAHRPRRRLRVGRRQAPVPRRPLAALAADEAILWDIRAAARRPRCARRRDARARRRLVPGRVPEPARRPVPARGRRRRRPRGDDRGRLHCAGSTSSTRSRRRRSSAGPSRSWPRTRSAARPAGPGGATLILAGVTVAAFFTAVQTFVQQQHSDTLQQVYSWILGAPAELGLARGHAPAAVRRRRDRRASCSTGGCSTCSASATRRRRASA